MAKFKIKEFKGVPTLHIDGIPKFAQIVWEAHSEERPEVKYKNATKFAKSGCHIYLFTTYLGWTSKENVYDYGAIEKEMETILAKDPDGYLIPRINLGLSYDRSLDCPFFHKDPLHSWWNRKYPEELILGEDGKRIPKASYASRIWKKDAGRALKNFVNHFKKKPYYDRILGYFVGYGGWEESQYYYQGSFTDFSLPMVKGFRNWLREKYQGDVSLLRKAWSDKNVNFNNAKIPEGIKRFQAELGDFKNPSINNQATDYYFYQTELMADTIIYFCKIVKEETKGQVLCGTAFGGTMDIGQGYINLNHHQVTRLLNSPDIDFLENPHSYAYRHIGIGDCSFMGVTESMKLHGKLRINESDGRTSLSPLTQRVYGRPDNIKESIEILKRDFAQVLCRGVGHWWLDSLQPSRSNLDHPQLWRCLTKLHRIGNLSIGYDRSFHKGLAMISDIESSYYLKRGSSLLHAMFYEQRCKEFGRIGTTWDAYFHNDLPQMPDYKVYLFLNTFYLTSEERNEIKKKVCRDNNVVVWMYAPGFQDKDGFSLKNMRELTGINIKYEEIEIYPTIRITDSKHPLTKNLKRKKFGAGIPYGLGKYSYMGPSLSSVEPTFYADDPEAITLGRLLETEKVGFCIKDMGSWTSIYIASPILTSELLRNICKYARVHIYSETDDLLYANNHFLSIHTREEGEKRIKLPQRSDVYEIYEERLVGKNIKEFTELLPANITRIYLLK